MKAYVLSLGRLKMLRASITGEGDDFIKIPIWSVLVDHPDGMILYDTGVNIFDKDLVTPKYWNPVDGTFECTPEENILAQLKQLGVSPEDIRYVVVSHLHVDHEGNIHRFPHAEVIVSDTEFTMLMKEYGLGRFLESHGCPQRTEFFAKSGIKWKLIEEEIFPLANGVTLYQFGMGHSFSMLCMLLELPETGNIFLCSDAIYTKENIGPPISPPKNLRSREGYINTLKRIQVIAEEKNAALWYGHDSAFFSGLKKSTDGAYE